MEIFHGSNMVTKKYKKEYMHDKVNHFDYYNIYLFSMIKIDDMVQTLGYTREVDYHWIEDGKWVTLEKDVQLMFILNRLTESVFTIYV